MKSFYQYRVYDPVDGDMHDCETLEEAEYCAQNCIDECEDGCPEEYSNGELEILKVLKVSRFRVTDRKSDYEDEWPYDSGCEEVGTIEMVEPEALTEETEV
jgi:hypothetical protein